VQLNWSRAARTDKGVHAVGQIVSLNLQIQASETQQFVDRCNEFLPEDVSIWLRSLACLLNDCVDEGMLF